MSFLSRTLLLLALGLWLPWLSLAAEATRESAGGKLVLRSWMKPQGLPNNVVNCLAQDEAGYLWMGTMVGLVRFDGLSFRKIQIPNARGSAELNVADLCLLADGTVAFIPAFGGIYTMKDGVATEHPSSASFQGLRLRKLHIEKSGVIWAATEQQVLRLQDGTLDSFPLEKTDQLVHRELSWAEDETGKTWVAGPRLLAYFSGGKLVRVQVPGEESFRICPSKEGAPLLLGKKMYRLREGAPQVQGELPWLQEHRSIDALLEDGKGRIWVATSKAEVYRMEAGRWSRLSDLKEPVRSFSEDREGNVWVTSGGGGLIRVRDQGFTLLPCIASGVEEDEEGAIWVAKGMEGIERRKAGEETQFHPKAEGSGRISTRLICSDAQGRLWLGSPSGLFCSETRSPEQARLISDECIPETFLRTRAGFLWVLTEQMIGHTQEGSFKPVPVEDAQKVHFSCAAEDRTNHFLFGTKAQGLYEGDLKGIRPDRRFSGFKFGMIHSIWVETAERVWLGCSGGLVLIEGSRIHKFTAKDGLPESTVLQVLPDQLGYLWLVHSGQLSRVAKESLLERSRTPGASLELWTYGQEEGLVAFSPRVGQHPTLIRDRDSRLWLCTQKELVLVVPEQLSTSPRAVPVFLDSVQADKETLRHGPCHITPGTRTVTFGFNALSFTAPERVILRHQLLGADRDWVPTPANRQASYTGLPPGDYLLRVLACNSDGRWNPERIEIPITILPAWWQRTWLRGALILLGLALLAWTVRLLAQHKLKQRVRELERQQSIEKERARIARDLHDELGGSLTGINLLVQRMQDSPHEQHPRLLEQLNNRLRRLSMELDRVVWIVSPKNSSLDKLGAFIERFAHSLFKDSRINCRVHGVATLPALPLSPQCQHQLLAIIKEALNNQIKHSRASEALISLQLIEGELRVSVRDNGMGFAPSAAAHSERNGLQNMQARADEIEGKLEISSKSGQGTEVSLRIPLRSVTH